MHNNRKSPHHNGIVPTVTQMSLYRNANVPTVAQMSTTVTKKRYDGDWTGHGRDILSFIPT